MANTRKTRRPEWAVKPMRRGTLRLCERCLRDNPRCQDSRRFHYGWRPRDSWKNHRAHQWREKERELDKSPADMVHEISTQLPFYMGAATSGLREPAPNSQSQATSQWLWKHMPHCLALLALAKEMPERYAELLTGTLKEAEQRYGGRWEP